MLWQGLKIVDWGNPLNYEGISSTPDEVLDFLAGLGTPIRVLEDNILKINLSGFLRRIQKENDRISILVKGMDRKEKRIEVQRGGRTAILLPVLSS